MKILTKIVLILFPSFGLANSSCANPHLAQDSEQLVKNTINN